MSFGVRQLQSGATYTGELDSKLKGSGLGVLTADGTKVYSGQVQHSIPEGVGVHKDPLTGDEYVGEFRAGKRHGCGHLKHKTGDVAGYFAYDLAHGVCVARDRGSGRVLKGSFKNGKVHGFAFEKMAKGGRTFKGYFAGGRRDGPGAEENIDDGTYYQGAYADGCRHGVGFYRERRGGIDKSIFGFWEKDAPDRFIVEDDRLAKSVYEGQLIGGKRGGVGKIVTREYSYLGETLEGIKHGFGRYEDDFQSWIGNWNKDKKEGLGLSTQVKQNSVYFGTWKADKRDGFGILKTGDKIEPQMYSAGTLVQKAGERVGQLKELNFAKFLEQSEAHLAEFQALIDQQKSTLEQTFTKMDLEFEKDCDFIDSSLKKALARLEELQIEVETNNQIIDDKIRRLARQNTSTSVLANERSQFPTSPQVDKSVERGGRAGTPDKFGKNSREISPIAHTKGASQTLNRKNQQSEESPIYRNKDTNEIELNSATKQKYLDAFGSATSRLNHERYSPIPDYSNRSRSPNQRSRNQDELRSSNLEPGMNQRSASTSKLNSSGAKPALNRPYIDSPPRYHEAQSSWIDRSGNDIDYLPADCNSSCYNPQRSNSHGRSREASLSPEPQPQPKLWPEWRDDRPLPVFDPKPKPPGPSEQPTGDEPSTNRTNTNRHNKNNNNSSRNKSNNTSTSRNKYSNNTAQNTLQKVSRPAAPSPRSIRPPGLRAVPQLHAAGGQQNRPSDVARGVLELRKPTKSQIQKSKNFAKPAPNRPKGLYREPTFGSGYSENKPAEEQERLVSAQNESFGQITSEPNGEEAPK